MTFIITGWDGKSHIGRGTLVATERHGTHIVRLTTDDLGGFNTYRKGELVRIHPNEVLRNQRRHG